VQTYPKSPDLSSPLEYLKIIASPAHRAQPLFLIQDATYQESILCHHFIATGKKIDKLKTQKSISA
jgi:hypothetical protein